MSCLPANVYIILSKNQQGVSILGDITTEMPEIDVVRWGFQLDSNTVSV